MREITLRSCIEESKLARSKHLSNRLMWLPCCPSRGEYHREWERFYSREYPHMGKWISEDGSPMSINAIRPEPSLHHPCHRLRLSSLEHLGYWNIEAFYLWSDYNYVKTYGEHMQERYGTSSMIQIVNLANIKGISGDELHGCIEWFFSGNHQRVKGLEGASRPSGPDFFAHFDDVLEAYRGPA